MSSETANTRVLPMSLLIQAGLSGSFEELSQPFATELIEQRCRDRVERIAVLQEEIAVERRALVALSELAAFIDPPVSLEPMAALPRKVS